MPIPGAAAFIVSICQIFRIIESASMSVKPWTALWRNVVATHHECFLRFQSQQKTSLAELISLSHRARTALKRSNVASAANA